MPFRLLESDLLAALKVRETPRPFLRITGWGLVVLIFAMALAAAHPVEATTRVELTCPEFVHTRQELASRHEGWSAGPSRLEVEDGLLRHRGGPSGFSTGPGHESAFLVPDADGWRIPDGGDVWLDCAYHETKIILSKRVPEGATFCDIDVDAETETASAWCNVRSIDQRQLSPLTEGSTPPELRMWHSVALFEESVEGIVVTPGVVRFYAGDGVAKARQVARLETAEADEVLRHLDALAAYDGRWLSCSRIKDGASLEVEGVSSAGRFAFKAHMPNLCDDGPAREVSNVYARLRALRE